ncbi:GNAT family N-acetyltransferase [Leptolyngbya sp. FACHB-16]|uniref:GNAT family N-acetyltransferase n=1 Tax=unclassified Leptolyngbya TaxID=2650499 RepID=UPI0016888405|nr:GNAT family N-acetyltransferase [Leptolyngbya sp. FACHB-16]MBD1911216.1 GNAT family N-acetyltransferase [Leptolyngbya sp. FACHB-8]MBD2155463.1 GNAT family N-acetyltransferase [Leptolyngbya sp. FACHB-16]
MESNLSFRSATPSDIPRLLPMIQAYYAYDQHPDPGDRLPQALEDLLAHPHWGRIWLICCPNPIGYVMLALGYSLEALGQEACVDEIYLQEPYRGQGIGRKTFDFIEGFCQQQGIKRLYLEVERHNSSAQRLYRNIGFEDNDRQLLTRWVKPSQAGQV